METSSVWNFLNGAALLLLATCIGVAGWTARSVVRLSERVSGVESGRFSRDEAHQLWKKVNELQLIAANREPPDWLIKRLDRIEGKVDELMHRIVKNDACPNPPP